MAESKIEWTDYTFNPWIGCSKVSAGCANCYAERDFDKRKGRAKWGPSGTRSRTSESNWNLPRKWNRFAVDPIASAMRSDFPRRPRVFCASLADVFEDWDGPIVDHKGAVLLICDACGKHRTHKRRCDHCDVVVSARRLTMADLRRDLFALIDATPNLDWLIVTKRPENIRRMRPASARWVKTGNRVEMLESPIGSRHFCGTVYDESHRKAFSLPGGYEVIPHGGPVCERGAGERETVEECKAEIERAFGGINYRKNVWLLTSVENQETADQRIPELLRCRDLAPVLGLSCEPLLGPIDVRDYYEAADGDCWMDPLRPRRGCLNWVIAGGESGSGARPMHPDWARSLRDQCQAAGVPFFFKQWGRWLPQTESRVPRQARVVYPGGRVSDHISAYEHARKGLHQACRMHPVSKKSAGRLLDGVEHSAYPTTQEVI